MENSKVLLHKNFHYGIIYYRIAADVCGLCLRELDAFQLPFLLFSKFTSFFVHVILVHRWTENDDFRDTNLQHFSRSIRTSVHLRMMQRNLIPTLGNSLRIDGK